MIDLHTWEVKCGEDFIVVEAVFGEVDDGVLNLYIFDEEGELFTVFSSPKDCWSYYRMISKLPEKQKKQTGWIKCSEQEPPKDKPFLAKTIKGMAVLKKSDNYRGYTLPPHHNYIYFDTEEVYEWQPLPED